MISSISGTRRRKYRRLETDNLQYNTLGRWVDGTIVSLTKRLMFQVLFFFIISCKILCKNPFNLFSYFLKNIWNIRLLVDDSFVPSSKQPSVIYCRLTDFCCRGAFNNYVDKKRGRGVTFVYLLSTWTKAWKLDISTSKACSHYQKNQMVNIGIASSYEP